MPFGKGQPFLNGAAGGPFSRVPLLRVLNLTIRLPFTPLFAPLSTPGYVLATERGDLVARLTSPTGMKRRVGNGTRDGPLIRPQPASTAHYAPGTFGNIPLLFRAPYGRALDLALAKVTRLGEVTRFELRADILNVTNERLHRLDIANNVFANNVLTNPLVGSIPERRFLFNPRVIQLGLKFIF